MRKVFAGALAAALCCSLAIPVYATDISQDSEKKEGNTTLTTSKAATYLVMIPEAAQIVFDTEVNPIGDIIYQSGNLEPDAYVTVELSDQTPLVNSVDDQYTIEYEIQSDGVAFEKVIYNEETAAGSKMPLTANISGKEWDEAKAGDYAATLTFTVSYTNPHGEE